VAVLNAVYEGPLMKFTARRYDTSEPISIEIVGENIASILPISDGSAHAKTQDQTQNQNKSLSWIAPGLVDLQINGGGGQEFSDAKLTAHHVHCITSSQPTMGVTSYCPTLTTHSFDTLRHAAATIAKACIEDSSVAAMIAGIHLEGPYISTEDGPRGAHPLQHCRPPDWDEFQRLQEAANGLIKLITLSPEYPQSNEMIRRLVSSGVLVSIGHTAATPEQITSAVDAGARMSTHLGNGAHGQIRRHPNYIWQQLAEDRLVASLIVDGHHLPPAVVKSFVRAKSPARCVLVSDITGLGGKPPGRYETGLGAVEILEDGRMVVAGQRQLLAGAALPMTYGVANVMRFAGVDLATAIEMSSIRPAQLIGIATARLEVGSRADLILFDLPAAEGQPIAIRTTIQGGQVFRPPSTER